MALKRSSVRFRLAPPNQSYFLNSLLNECLDDFVKVGCLRYQPDTTARLIAHSLRALIAKGVEFVGQGDLSILTAMTTASRRSWVSQVIADRPMISAR
jgi:hypothetical protein